MKHSDEAGGRVEAVYDASEHRWTLQWGNGPTLAAMTARTAALAGELAEHGFGGYRHLLPVTEHVRFERRIGDIAFGLALIDLAAAAAQRGERLDRNDTYRLEYLLEEQPYPGVGREEAKRALAALAEAAGGDGEHRLVAFVTAAPAADLPARAGWPGWPPPGAAVPDRLWGEWVWGVDAAGAVRHLRRVRHGEAPPWNLDR
ncbi:hypothetical protein AB0I28_32040 [Phytomonospora sp. NPDC050363]|uniref:hypothetical protein n=1 Tax=Phytomonospora sp. NPDC050363 TaxID=3155642 RepID=UPI0033E14A52